MRVQLLLDPTSINTVLNNVHAKNTPTGISPCVQVVKALGAQRSRPWFKSQARALLTYFFKSANQTLCIFFTYFLIELGILLYLFCALLI